MPSFEIEKSGVGEKHLQMLTLKAERVIEGGGMGRWRWSKRNVLFILTININGIGMYVSLKIKIVL